MFAVPEIDVSSLHAGVLLVTSCTHLAGSSCLAPTPPLGRAFRRLQSQRGLSLLGCLGPDPVSHLPRAVLGALRPDVSVARTLLFSSSAQLAFGEEAIVHDRFIFAPRTGPRQRVGVGRQRAGGVPDATLTSAVPGASTALDQETRGLDTVVSKVLYGQVGFR